MVFNATRAQGLAINTHDRNLIVMAGAGSGKTRVLVERYLKLLHEHPDWSLNALVAITFTQKAAQEMRDRVRQAVQTALANAADAESQRVWAGRMSALGSARIDTIHALCASILRANAAEANVDPGFEVLDETEAAILLDDAVDDVLRLLPTDDSAALALFREYDSTAIRKALKAFAGGEIAALVPPDSDPTPNSRRGESTPLMQRWHAAWADNARTAITRLLRQPEYQAGWQPAAVMPAGADKLFDVWLNCAAHLTALRGEGDISAKVEALARLKATIKLNVGAEKAWGGKETLKAAKAALEQMRDQAAEALETAGDPPGDLDERAAHLLPLWVALVERVRTAYRAAKVERGALDFDDLEHETRELLKNPAVAARYRGTEFKHILVDEFQDTNRAQWEIVKALADPAIPGCLFVVGDAKQSIYQFRGADVSVFDAVQAEITSARGDKIDMARSFRTHQALVTAFNALFRRILQRHDDHPARAYQIALDAEMEAERSESPGDTPPLELLLLDKGLKVEDRRAWEARELARRVRQWVEEERRPVYDKQKRVVRPIDYGDIAFLFQAMTHLNTYEDALKAAGIPYVAVAGRGYFDRQEVWDLLNLLTALYNPADELALASALRSPLFNLSDEALFGLRFERDARLWDALDHPEWVSAPDGNSAPEASVVTFARDTLRDLRTLAGRVTISELLVEALDRTGYLAVLTGLPDGARRRGNVEKLIDKARTSGKTTLGAFSQYVQDLRAREAREGEAALDAEGAIRLMTVHKSKGLEFPLVVLVDSSYDWTRGNRGKPPLIYDAAAGWACTVYDHDAGNDAAPFAYRHAERLRDGREEAEKRRLLYVAATRAQDYLIVSGTVKWNTSGALSGTGWLAWLIDALDMADHPREAEAQRMYDWGAVDVRCCLEALPAPPPLDLPVEAAISVDRMDAPPLLALLPALDITAAARRVLTATQIADMGSALHGSPDDTRPRYRERWRRSIFGDAPAHIDRASLRDRGITEKKIGDIVHQAIRDDLPTDRHTLENLLGCRAWEHGIVTDEAREDAARRAYNLLQKVQKSDVFGWIRAAKQILREVPFIYHTERRAIHGQIDLLIERPDGQWAVIDYKTSYVRGVTFDEHVRQYLPQVGVYAAAVSALLGAVPQVYIHYIRHEKTIAIPETDWRSALARLEDDIGSLLE